MKFIVTGMSCAACSAKVQKVVSALNDVTSCEVNLLTSTMTVHLTNESPATINEILKAVKKAGYSAEKVSNKSSETISQKQHKALKFLYFRLFTSLLLLLLIMYAPLPQLLSFVFTLSIMLINCRFFINGFKAVFHKSPNMDTLVTLGALASFAYGSLEGTGMILTFITVGKTLEELAKGKTTNTLKNLIKLTPQTATIIKDGDELVVPVETINCDDEFVVKPGENIPVDGFIIEGNACVDESSLTGESIPVDKHEKDEVSAGTINLTGFIKCKATRVGEDTTIAQIIQFVSDSAASKAPVQRIADKAAAVFVPVVLFVSIVTSLIWFLICKDVDFSILRGISVLVISCPCALGLATPVAIMVGNGIGAKKGILFKTSAALERTGKAQIVVLDKTGTITKGKPKVVEAVTNESDFLEISYLLEKNSNHPVAKAICSYIEENSDMNFKERKLIDYVETAGKGICATDEKSGDKLFCGVLANSNYICVTKNGKTIGKFVVQDEIKEDSIMAVGKLKKMGLKVVMLTGDNWENAKMVSESVGIDNYIARLLPNQKAQEIIKLKKEGTVIMVGDGINDSPSLTIADVGMAIGAGSDIALDSADVVLVKDNIMDVATSINISKAVLKNIKENLFWAFFYNACAIPIAAGCFVSLGLEITPAISSACMSLSSFCVVCNALRLNLKFKK